MLLTLCLPVLMAIKSIFACFDGSLMLLLAVCLLADCDIFEPVSNIYYALYWSNMYLPVPIAYHKSDVSCTIFACIESVYLFLYIHTYTSVWD